MRFLLFLAPFVTPFMAWAADGGGQGASPNAVPLGTSPFSAYTAGAVTYVLITMVLVLVLLIGGFLVVNLGMMSQRKVDKKSHQEPSDVGILRSERFPNDEAVRRVLPPETDADQITVPRPSERIDEKTLLKEEDMAPDADPFPPPRHRKGRVA